MKSYLISFLFFGLVLQCYISRAQVTVKNKNQYSKKFIDELKEFASRNHYKKIELVDSLILLHGKRDRRIYFPTLPKIKRTYELNATVENFHYELKLFRQNYTDMDFDIVISQGSENVFEKSGRSFLFPLLRLKSLKVQILVSLFIFMIQLEKIKIAISYLEFLIHLPIKNCT